MTGFTTNVLLYRNRVPSRGAFEGLELCEGKLSCTVLRGLGDRKVAWLLGRTAKEITCGKHFGALIGARYGEAYVTKQPPRVDDVFGAYRDREV